MTPKIVTSNPLGQPEKPDGGDKDVFEKHDPNSDDEGDDDETNVVPEPVDELPIELASLTDRYSSGCASRMVLTRTDLSRL